MLMLQLLVVFRLFLELFERFQLDFDVPVGRGQRDSALRVCGQAETGPERRGRGEIAIRDSKHVLEAHSMVEAKEPYENRWSSRSRKCSQASSAKSSSGLVG